MKSYIRLSSGLVVLLSSSMGLSSCYKVATKADSEDTGSDTDSDTGLDTDLDTGSDTDTEAYNEVETEQTGHMDEASGADTGSDAPEDTAADSDSDAAGRPGVVSGGKCFPLCLTTTEGSDPQNPDWGYEDSKTCVIPDSATATTNQACGPNEPLPEPEDGSGQPGVVVALNGETGERTCVALCIGTTDIADDPDGDGWSWELNSSCVIPNSVNGQNQACTTGEAVPAPTS